MTDVNAKVNGKDEAIVVFQASGTSINFTGNATGNECEKEYKWNFGDGGASLEQNPTHIYSNLGKYDVNLTVKCKECTLEKNDTVKVHVGKLKFINPEVDVDWEKDGEFDPSSNLEPDNNIDNLMWSISGSPSVTINSDTGIINFSDINKYDDENEGTYVVTVKSVEEPSISDSFELNVVAYLKVPVILKQLDINFFGNDKYGHWWTEINNNESYGWWPAEVLSENWGSIWNTLVGVDGDLNGQTLFSGTPTVDPHHGDSADHEIQTFVKSHERTKDEVLTEIRGFANSYSGEWSWRPGDFGQNCHSFQNSLVSEAKLVREDAIE